MTERRCGTCRWAIGFAWASNATLPTVALVPNGGRLACCWGGRVDRPEWMAQGIECPEVGQHDGTGCRAWAQEERVTA